MKIYGKHRFPGRLFVVEGIDGSGKSTQLALLQKWLESEGYGTFFSEWNSSALVRDVTRRGKKKRMLTPMTFSLIHATDFADRTEQHIIPPLKAGALVLADRYVYTAFARDVARGVNAGWVRNLYRFAVKPTIAFLLPHLGGRSDEAHRGRARRASVTTKREWTDNSARISKRAFASSRAPSSRSTTGWSRSSASS